MTPWVMRLMLANGISAILNEVGPTLIMYTAFVPADIFIAPWTIIT